MLKTYRIIPLVFIFLVIGGTFEKATARELRSGMDLLKICTKNLPFEEGKKIDYHSMGHCQGFVEGVSGALSNPTRTLFRNLLKRAIVEIKPQFVKG